MKKLASALLIALSMAGCGNLLDPAAAVVYGEKIPIDEVQAVVDDFGRSEAYNERAQQGEGDILKRDFERNYLSQLIRRAVLGPRAEELGVDVTEADIDQRIDAIRSEFPDEQTFKERLAEEGLNMELLRGFVRDAAIENELRKEVTKDVKPSEEELVDYYHANIARYRETRPQHILVDDQELADRLVAQLNLAIETRRDDLFAELAEKHSTDQGSARSGGELGYGMAGRFVAPFERALRDLDEGEVSEPIKTEFGWHVIRIIDRRTRTFEQARTEIVEELSTPLIDDAWADWLADAYDRARVEVNPRYGAFDPEQQLVVDPDADDVPGAEESREEPPAPAPLTPGP
ncbi:MAG TPA: peptidylprolyl isomerase [Actinomycetota bacterium]|nr:peptidylprolyl isomerase [Actinomycetota bacterium]